MTGYLSPALVYINFTIVAQMLSFLILLYLLNRILYKPLLKFMDERSEKIENDIERAKDQRENAEKTLAEAHEHSDLMRAQSYSIKKDAADMASKEKQSLIDNAQKDARAIVERARLDMGKESAKIREDLKRSLGINAVEIAEKVLGQTLTDKQKEAATRSYLDNVHNHDTPGAPQ